MFLLLVPKNLSKSSLFLTYCFWEISASHWQKCPGCIRVQLMTDQPELEPGVCTYVFSSLLLGWVHIPAERLGLLLPCCIPQSFQCLLCAENRREWIERSAWWQSWAQEGGCIDVAWELLQYSIKIDGGALGLPWVLESAATVYHNHTCTKPWHRQGLLLFSVVNSPCSPAR